jgi:hypothetical protein
MALPATLAPDFMVDLTLYPTDQGGRREPITREGFGCPCKLLDEKNNNISDCRLILSGESIAPGETKRVGIRFSVLPQEAVPDFPIDPLLQSFIQPAGFSCGMDA